MSLKTVQFQYLSAKEFISEFSKGQQFQNICLIIWGIQTQSFKGIYIRLSRNLLEFKYCSLPGFLGHLRTPLLVHKSYGCQGIIWRTNILILQKILTFKHKWKSFGDRREIYIYRVCDRKMHSLSTTLHDFEVERSLCYQAKTYFVLKTKDNWLHDCIPKQMFIFWYWKNKICWYSTCRDGLFLVCFLRYSQMGFPCLTGRQNWTHLVIMPSVNEPWPIMCRQYRKDRW